MMKSKLSYIQLTCKTPPHLCVYYNEVTLTIRVLEKEVFKKKRRVLKKLLKKQQLKVNSIIF